VGVAAALGLITMATGRAQAPLTLKVHTGRGQIGYDVNSTLVIGEKDILLIDPQFSLSEAHKLAAEILESKKHLATIYSTHPHPDHLFGLAVLKQAFPDAKIVCRPRSTRRRQAGRRGRNSGSRRTARTSPDRIRCCRRNSPPRC
jgi:glyoxylase-like metal-dependent hydrolase (beta-lactamase superfamily II)